MRLIETLAYDESEEVQAILDDMRARAAKHGRSLRFGYRAHVIVRETESEWGATVLAEFDAIDSYTTIAGFSLLTGTTQSNAGFIFLQLKDWDERPDREDHASVLVRRLNGAFATQITEAVVFAFGPPAIPGLGTGSGFTMMLQDRSGSSPAYLAGQTQNFVAAAQQRPEIASIGSLYRASVPQVAVDIDSAQALKMGVSLSDINTSIGAFLGGAYVNDFNRFGRLYKAYIQAEPEYRLSEDRINLFFVKNSNGDRVPLSAFVNIKEVAGPDFTNRFNLYRSVELTGGPAPGYTSAQALARRSDKGNFSFYSKIHAHLRCCC